MPKINRNGVNIHYEVHGSGPALLLTHGYSSTSAMWQGQIEALSKHHKLVLWDMRGHGQSDYPDDPAAYSEALTVVVDNKDYPKPHSPQIKGYYERSDIVDGPN